MSQKLQKTVVQRIKQDPLDLARGFAEDLQACGQDILFSRGDFYIYGPEVGWDFFCHEKFRSELYAFLESRGCSPKKHMCDNVEDALKAVCLVEISEDPFWLTPRTESAKNFISCKNGLVHLPSGELKKLDSKFFTLGTSNFEFDAKNTECVEFEKFLLSIFGSSPRGLDTINVLQEIFGWLISHDTSLQKAFLFVGKSRSGKGTLARILSALVGQRNVCSPTLSSFSSDFGLASLIGKSLAVVSDARISNRANTSAVVENILRITGEDLLNIPRKFRNDWIGTLPTRILILSNEVPSLMDSSGAFASRFILIHFPNSFLGKEDPDLTKKLLQELPAIFNWALAGLKRLHARGCFVQPKGSTQALELLQATNSPIQSFIQDSCVLDSGAAIKSEELFEAWSIWCDSNHRDLKGTNASFGKNLFAAFPQIERKRLSVGRGPDGRRPWFYTGVRLAGVSDPIDTDVLGPDPVE